MRHMVAYAFAIAGTMIAASAMAQEAGTYTGMNNEGDTVEIVVTQDSTTGDFEITSLSDGGTVYCSATVTYGYGVGFGGDLAAITDGKATFDALYSDVGITSSYKFTGNEVSGKIVFTVPILVTTKKAQACSTKSQTFKATLSPSSVTPAWFPKTGVAWRLGK